MKRMRLLILVLVLVMASGCASHTNNMNAKGMHAKGTSTDSDHIVRIKTMQNTLYVSLDQVAKAIGYQTKWLNDNSFGVGDNDPALILRKGESEAIAGNRTIQLPAPALQEGNDLYVPVAALKSMFGDEAFFKVDSKSVTFFPRPVNKGDAVSGKGLDFANAPSAQSAPEPTLDVRKQTYSIKVKSTSTKQIDDMLAFAKKYMGVPYEFGAGKYSKSKAFDCSSYVQHVFQKVGVTLPRLARTQAGKGVAINRDQLQPGDLLFFSVPGRFKSDKTVGHVGIYYKNGMMIHSSPKPKDGVQITSINKAYWKDTFLFAKRIRIRG
ncbi:MAG: NlpC/P60 family protein [Candidatus Cohnella colombiensis]|uniref:NlpC/P60 family protein n=1 Tax=Candidatus Cohnella colombiensis TaxID=3121368 RepID=A0AA95F1R2_9BACL|nr:MAG: NlpC/P60 family protein [Cohnella sp.]